MLCNIGSKGDGCVKADVGEVGVQGDGSVKADVGEVGVQGDGGDGSAIIKVMEHSNNNTYKHCYVIKQKGLHKTAKLFLV